MKRALRYWEAAGAQKTFTHPIDLDWLAARLPNDARIVDFGCGYGRLTRMLTDAGWTRVTGVDRSEALIARGRAERPDLDFRRIDELPLDEPDGAFDAALIVAVLTTIPTDAGQDAVMAELKRLIRPGGLLLLSDYPLQPDERNLARYEAGLAGLPYGAFAQPDGGVMRHHPPERIGEWLAGFEVVERASVRTLTMNFNPVDVVQVLARRAA